VLELAPKARKMDGYGGYHLAVSGADAEAQAWFDQGLQLVYGFNHDAAVYSFAAAAAAAPDCTMAWWGIAYAYGIDVNNPDVMEVEAARAYTAAQEALRLVESGDATTVEAALVRAVAERAVYPLPEDRIPLDEAYAEAMARAFISHTGNVDVATLYAESLMNLQPWDYWTADGEAVRRAEEIVAVLEGGMSNNELHPGANHFYIHAVEASKDPARAVPAAERLEALVPGSGHLVHMPSHIYINVGRYADAADANTRAIEADADYFATVGEPTFYRLYFIHNIHFLAHAAMMEGRSQIALDALRRMEREVPEDFLQLFPEFADGLMPAKFHGLIRFGRWQEILDEPEYPAYRKVSVAMRHYARAVALANLQRPADAREALAQFDTAVADTPEDWLIGANPAAAIYELARQMAEGEILWWEDRPEEAFAMLRTAVATEDALVYDEPPGWMIPVRHALGAILLAGEQPDEAIEVYRVDLEDNPRNAWSLLGLQQALRAAGQDAEADALDADVQAAWSRADVEPPASCYCGLKPA
jgi:tetratricopeptide (TPR) repeat protein